MASKYTTSANIVRDQARTLSYIVTPNARRVVDQLSSDFKKGIRSFNIIGSYGTGKSSFLWALQQSLLGKKKLFTPNLVSNPQVEFINLVGEYRSIIEAFSDEFDISSNRNRTENILSEIYGRYHKLGKRSPLLVILIDEFGKFLEYASQNSPEKELYFIQQLAEFANNADYNILLITTVHQNFDAYAYSLTVSQKQEWTKVKGRFREITFNEPIEQLLFLAAEHLQSVPKDKKTETEVKNALILTRKAKAFTLNAEYAQEISGKLFPLDLIAANILTLSLQRYGQNERSLFSFLESTDHTGIHNFDRLRNPFFNAACVYDYLIFNFYSFINSRYNPDFAAWASIKNALDLVERTFDNQISDYCKIIKTIGLLNVHSAAGAELGNDFLENYSIVCLGIRNAPSLIRDLDVKNIIKYRSYSKRYVITEGTDLDISSALLEAANKVNEIRDVATLLNRYYQFSPVIAKEYSYVNGTPRVFEFKISENAISDVPADEIDGYINLIFNEKISVDEVRKASQKQEEAILYGFYKNSRTIKNQLFEIEKTRKVLEENSDDNGAVKELQIILVHQQNLLTHYILNNLYNKNSEIKWFFKGEELKISSKRVFNQHLSQICYSVYSKTPIFRNELVNKHKISSSIHTAKKNYIRALVDNWDKPDLGFETTKYPPEKTIYLTLLKENGINLYSDEIIAGYEISKKSSFVHLWRYSNTFLESTKDGRRPLSEFIEPLTRRPFKIKQGVIDFWLASFLFLKRDDYALFGSSGYIPYLSDEVLELVLKYPEDYEVKAFDIAGVKLDIFNSYRLFLNQNEKQKLDNQSFIETIKPFLVFYKGLTDYSKNTKRLNADTLAIRSAIVESKDPEKTFFEDFPMALGYRIETLQKSKSELQNYITKLQSAIRELRTSYDALIGRFEEFIIDEFIGENSSFEDYKELLQQRFKRLKRHLCLPHQKTFVLRLDSKIDDKTAWLNSLAQTVIGKSLDLLKDEEEVILYDKFKSTIRELDNLTALAKGDFDTNKESVFGIEMSSFVDGIHKRLVRVPKTKVEEISKVEKTILSKLSKDNTIDIVALANVLKKLLSNEKG